MQPIQALRYEGLGSAPWLQRLVERELAEMDRPSEFNHQFLRNVLTPWK
jgi:hypothetical protein